MINSAELRYFIFYSLTQTMFKKKFTAIRVWQFVVHFKSVSNDGDSATSVTK